MNAFSVRLLALATFLFLGGLAWDRRSELHAQEPAKAGAANQLADLQRYIPRDALVMGQLNVKELRENQSLAKLLLISRIFGYFNGHPDNLEYPAVDWLMHGILPPSPEQDKGKWLPLLILKGSSAALPPEYVNDKAEDSPKFIKVNIPELGLPVSVLSRSEELALKLWQKNATYYEPNEGTRIIGFRGRNLLQALKPSAEVRDAGWHALLPLQNIKQSTLVAAFDLARLRQLFAMQQDQLHPAINRYPTFLRLLHLLSQNADQVVLGVNCKNGAQLTAIFQTADAAQAAEFKKAVEEQLQGLRQKLPQHLDVLRQLKFADPITATQLSTEIQSLYNSIQLVHKDKLFRLTMQADQKLFEVLAKAAEDPNVGAIPVLIPELPEPTALQRKAEATKGP